MKKTYTTPETLVVHMAATMPIAASDPNVTVTQEDNDNVNAKDIEVKSQPGYNVWDDDWSE